MSLRTALCIVNFAGQAIQSIVAKNVSGFENNQAFKSYLPSSGIANNTSHCGYLEIDNSGPSNYTLTVTFADGSTVTFEDDQHNALVKHVRRLPHQGSASIEVYQVSGGNTGSQSHGTNGIYLRKLPAPDHSTWMEKVLKARPDASLNRLSLPGSHDAGMYKISYAFDITTEGKPEWVKTQALRIADQLVAGARYFDLRIRNDQGILCAAHWSDVAKTYGALGAELNEILNDVVNFLRTRGSKEVIVLKFSHGNDPELCGKVVKRVKDIVGGADLLYNPAGAKINLATSPLLQTTPLSEMAGKVLAVFGGDGSGYDSYWKPAEGIFPYLDMPLQNASDANVHITPTSRLYVYDHYANDGNYERMWADQEPKLKNYGGWGKQYLFSLAWTLSGGGSVSDIEVLAGIANPWLPKALSALQSSNKPNIVSLDYLDPYLCGAVIAAN